VRSHFAGRFVERLIETVGKAAETNVTLRMRTTGTYATCCLIVLCGAQPRFCRYAREKHLATLENIRLAAKENIPHRLPQDFKDSFLELLHNACKLLSAPDDTLDGVGGPPAWMWSTFTDASLPSAAHLANLSENSTTHLNNIGNR
jgi:hypothetical protein